MDTEKFINWCKAIITDFVVDNIKTEEVPEFEVYEVWNCKTLQNNKALLSTTLPDKMYYECTYNGDKKEIYFDAYKKLENKAIKIEEEYL